jgi:hypothetical protein
MAMWARVGATAVGASVLLFSPAAALASPAHQPHPARSAPTGPPPPRPLVQTSTAVASLPTRERSTATARASSISLLHLADTEQLA